MQGNKQLIVYVITYGPKSTRSPLGDAAPWKYSPTPYNFKKAQSPENIPLLNSLVLPPNFRGFNTLKAQRFIMNLTLSWRRPLSYRNKSMYLLCKSIDWFLYDNGLRHERINSVLEDYMKQSDEGY